MVSQTLNVQQHSLFFLGHQTTLQFEVVSAAGTSLYNSRMDPSHAARFGIRVARVSSLGARHPCKSMLTDEPMQIARVAQQPNNKDNRERERDLLEGSQLANGRNV